LQLSTAQASTQVLLLLSHTNPWGHAETAQPVSTQVPPEHFLPGLHCTLAHLSTHLPSSQVIPLGHFAPAQASSQLPVLGLQTVPTAQVLFTHLFGVQRPSWVQVVPVPVQAVQEQLLLQTPSWQTKPASQATPWQGSTQRPTRHC
jgi:hypothetical protein